MDPESADLPNGVTLPYVERGDPAGDPLVLLHGYVGSWRSFELVLAHLPASVRAIAPTQRGHGEASKPTQGYRVGDFATDLVAFLDVLGVRSAVVAGASSGGLVARRFAIDHPGRTRGLVLLGTPARLRGKAPVEEMWESTISTLKDPVDPAFVRDFAAAAVSPAVPKVLVEEAVRTALKAPARVWRETNRGLLEDDADGELDQISEPTLIIWGDGDPLSPRDEQERLVETIPEARLVVYRGAGHSLTFEEPERVAADLAAFVEEVAGGARRGGERQPTK